MKREPNLEMDIGILLEDLKNVSDEEIAVARAKVQREWIDIREKAPTDERCVRVQIQVNVPCFFDCAKDGTALMAYIKGKYLHGEDGLDSEAVYAFPIDLTNKERKWKWKLNEKDENHYEDFYAWTVRHSGGIYLMDMPDNYHCYRRRKNEFKTFKREFPMNGTNIILQFEMRCIIDKQDGEYWVTRDEEHFMNGEFQVPFKIHLEQEDLIIKWKDRY